jgi:mannose-6-phosphate isomerase-like protein (cupin superfamily)
MALLAHREHEDRPWGSFNRFTLNEPSTVKIVCVSAGKEFSLQYHHNRAEFWRIIHGEGVLTLADARRNVHAGDEIEIPVGVEHRLLAGASDLLILEIALGNFDESDITRLKDDFGRAPSA